MSTRKQLESFNLDFIKENMKQWVEASGKYEKEAEKAYNRMRSYLTLYQFRLTDEEKYNIREMLSQNLDDIDKADLVDEMDGYLEGFCFKLDKSVLPQPEDSKPTSVKIKVAPEPPQPNLPATNDTLLSSITTPETYHDNAVDYNDLDFYTMQFFQ